MKEDRDAGYWNRKWGVRGQHLHERVFLDGSDGEEEFDAELRRNARGKEILDVGCGPGEFTLQMARNAKSVTGVDSSSVALNLAKKNLAGSGLRNVGFRQGDSGKHPFPGGTFDLVYSRRGPASDTMRNLAEVLRVLRPVAGLLEISFGERDKRNIAEIFGRGQKHGFRGHVSVVKRRWLEEVGLLEVAVRDYLGTEVFRSMADLVVRLRSAPIIPSFDIEKDRGFLEEVGRRCATERGVETPVHRVVLIARK